MDTEHSKRVEVTHQILESETYQLFGEKFTSKSRKALANAPTSSFREKMQEIISDLLLVSSSKYMEPRLFCTHIQQHTLDVALPQVILSTYLFLLLMLPLDPVLAYAPSLSYRC